MALMGTHTVKEGPALLGNGVEGGAHVPFPELGQDLGQGLHGLRGHAGAAGCPQGAQAPLQEQLPVPPHLGAQEPSAPHLADLPG